MKRQNVRTFHSEIEGQSNAFFPPFNITGNGKLPIVSHTDRDPIDDAKEFRSLWEIGLRELGQLFDFVASINLHTVSRYSIIVYSIFEDAPRFPYFSRVKFEISMPV